MIILLYRIAEEYRFLCEQISDMENEMQALVCQDDRGKRGHKYLKRYLIHGARSALQWHINKPTRWSDWAKELCKTKKANVVAVVLANKIARMIWVILARNERYQAVC